MPIEILPDHVARLIRAGEVVERPASVAKELVENALDAGATRITVSIHRGGAEMVAVEDDGGGMTPENLILCIERHATSKLREAADLQAVRTHGFRGEALAAIAAVSRLTLSSRTRGDDCGWRIRTGPSGAAEDFPCACPPGGTFAVAEGLFAEHPARAAFLKGPRAEANAVRAAVEAAALSRPDVSFELVSDGRTVLALAPSGWEARAREVCGDAFAANSVPFAGAEGGMRVRGLVGIPGWKGHAAAGQVFLVNGRPVRDRTISAAIRAAFSDLSGENSPAAVVLLEVDPAAVDVNAHPAKAEIRFRQPDAVHALVRAAVRNGLSGGDAAEAAMAALSARAAAAAVPLRMDGEGDRRRLPLGRPLGVALGGFAVCEANDGIVLVDLHAAAERAAYERLLAEATADAVPSRLLPAPVVVALSRNATAAIGAAEGALGRAGVTLSALDDTSVVVTRVPERLPGHRVAEFVAEAAGALARDAHAAPVADLLNRTCATLACHAAWRFGDELSPEGLDDLLREFERTPRIGTCMHGRPTIVSLPRDRVAGLFGRR